MSLVNVAVEVNNRIDATRKKSLYRDDPVLWAQDIAGVHLWSAQRKVAESIRDNQNVAVKAGHSVGKSFLIALLVCWWVDTRYPDCFVASTAPSQAQIGAIVWREVERVRTAIAKRYRDGLIDHQLP